MTRSKRLQPVQRVAASRENDAAIKMGESRQQLADQEARLDELKNYRNQYAAQFSTRGHTGLDVMQINDYRAFLARLTAAIQQQELLIEQYRSQHHQNQFHWQDVRRHTQAIDKLIARFRDDEQRQQLKREQQALDEHAARLHRRPEPAK